MKALANIVVCLLLLSSYSLADVTAKFNFENAAGATFRTEERQKISVNGNPRQQNKFTTGFEITEVAREGDSYHVEVAYRSQKAELVINGQAFDTTTNPQLKAASDDLVGRKLTYVVALDCRVKEVQGIEQLLKSRAGQMFGSGLDEVVCKRSFERILLARDDVDAPLKKGDGWQVSEETALDANTKFTLKSNVTLTDVDEHRLFFDVSSKGEIAAGNRDISIDTPRGTGKIIWNREVDLPASITLDTAVKITYESNPQSPVTLDVESFCKILLDPRNSGDAEVEAP